MLHITIPSVELWDETNEEFIYMKEQSLSLEHSLVSISKWESKWKKSFFSDEEKTFEEMIDYIKCMTITQDVSPDIYKYLSPDIIQKINEYMNDSMTATTFKEHSVKKSNGSKLTSEIIYYYMVALNIPFECQEWHINRLMTLIKVCDIKNRPQKKMTNREIMSRNSALNKARRQRLNSKG